MGDRTRLKMTTAATRILERARRRCLQAQVEPREAAAARLPQTAPRAVADTGGMVVPPHPHTALQTVSWLCQGEIDHRDSPGVPVN